MAEKLEIRPSKVNFALALIGSLLFVALGLWLALAGGAGVLEFGVGVLCIAFFGYATWIILTTFNQPRGLTLGEDGLYWRAPFVAPKRIPWTDIEAIGLYQIDSQKFATISISDVDSLVAQYSDEEARRTLRLMRTMLGFSRAALGAGAVLLTIAANFSFALLR